jgi:D-3-phosphoglycerate dehydrogenase
MSHRVGFFIKVPAELLRFVAAQLPAELELVPVETGSDAELLAKAGSVDFVVTGKASAAFIEAGTKLKLIQHPGVGLDKIDLVAAARRGIPVATCPHATTESVAEHTLMLMLAVSRRLVEVHCALGEGRWLMWERRLVSHNLRGRTLGIVGAGRIGQAVARLASSFGMNIQVHDPVSVAGLKAVSLAELFATSDIVSLHVPLTPQTRGMIGAEELGRMKRDAILINCARGELVDEKALHAALVAGRLGGAGIDVFAREPPDAGNSLLHLPNVIATPHTANGTFESFAERSAFYVRNIQRVLRGEAPECVVKPSI